MSPAQREQIRLRLERAAADRCVNTTVNTVNTPVNTSARTIESPPEVRVDRRPTAALEKQESKRDKASEPPPKRSSGGDRHPPGYMAEYMRKRRAKPKAP